MVAIRYFIIGNTHCKNWNFSYNLIIVVLVLLVDDLTYSTYLLAWSCSATSNRQLGSGSGLYSGGLTLEHSTEV